MPDSDCMNKTESKRENENENKSYCKNEIALHNQCINEN